MSEMDARAQRINSLANVLIAMKEVYVPERSEKDSIIKLAIDRLRVELQNWDK